MTKKMQQNIIFMVLVLGGLLFVYTRLLMKPLNEKFTDASTRLVQTETKLAEMKQRALTLPQLQADMKFLEAEVSDLEKLLPKEKEAPGLLRTVTNLAKKNGVRIANIVPGAIVSQPNYNELPYQMTISGTYHSVARFLTDIGQSSRVLSTKNILFSFLSGGNSKENPHSITVTFTLTAYTFKG